MNILASIFGGAAAAPIDAIGNIFDKLFTSDDERLDKKVLLTRLAQQPSMAQIELNKVEASHRSIFVAGWRPFIGWVCGISLAVYYIPQYLLASYLWVTMCLNAGHLVAYPVSPAGLLELVLALLGLGMLRTAEKFGGRTK
jgi:hypothetical protein